MDLIFKDLASNDLKFSDLKFSDLKFNDLKLKDLKFSEVKFKDLILKDLKFNELKFKDLKCKSLKQKKLRSKSMRARVRELKARTREHQPGQQTSTPDRSTEQFHFQTTERETNAFSGRVETSSSEAKSDTNSEPAIKKIVSSHLRSLSGPYGCERRAAVAGLIRRRYESMMNVLGRLFPRTILGLRSSVSTVIEVVKALQCILGQEDCGGRYVVKELGTKIR